METVTTFEGLGGVDAVRGRRRRKRRRARRGGRRGGRRRGLRDVQSLMAADDDLALPVDFPPLDEYGDEDGLAQFIPTMETLRELGVAGGAGGLALLASSYLVPVVPGPGWVKPVVTGVLGVVGGSVLWRQNRAAACGVAGALVGYAVASGVGRLLGKNVGADLGGLSQEEEEAAEEMLSQMPDEDEDENLLGASTEVETERRLGESTAVEPENRLGGGVSSFEVEDVTPGVGSWIT